MQCTLLKDGQYLTIAIAALAQHIFAFTEKANYLFVNLEISLESKQNNIPINHPSLPLLFEVLQFLNPIYGCTEAWTVDPEGYCLWRIRKEAPWHTMSSTFVLGRPISTIVSEHVDLESPDNDLYFVKKLGESLYFITSPDETSEQKKYKSHFDKLKQISGILESIPVSVLER